MCHYSFEYRDLLVVLVLTLCLFVFLGFLSGDYTNVSTLNQDVLLFFLEFRKVALKWIYDT